MIVYLANFVNIIVQLLTLLVIIEVFFSYFMSPYHPIRLNIDRIVEPMLRPIRQVIPSIGMLDISPLILIVLIQILGRISIGILALVFH